MARSDHQEPKDAAQAGNDFEPFMLDEGGAAGSGVTSSGSGQFAGAEMEFEAFMFNPGEMENGGTAVSTAPEPASTAAPAPVPVTGHAVPPPSYLTASSSAPQPQAQAAPGAGNGSSHPSTPDLSPMMMGRSRGHTGPLAAERLGATPTSWSDSSLASIADFSAVLIAVQAGRKLLQAGPVRTALPAPATATAQAVAAPVAAATMEQPQSMDMGQVPQWAAQAESGAQATAMPEAPPPFIAGADPSSPWATDRPEWASGAAQAAPPPGSVVADEEDAGLPPWLTEEAEAPARSDAPEMAAPAPEPAVLQAEERPELVSSAFTGTTGVGIQAPESTLHEPALETDEEVASALQAMDESQPSGLDGEKIEFEGFMFDQGTPAPIANLRGDAGVVTSGPVAPFYPEQGGPAGMVVDQDAHVEGESLPFWLNQAAEVQVTPGEGYVQAAEAAAHANDPLMMQSVTAADALDEDFEDLPPVQPFDFTQIEGKVEEETLGFNTEELIGMSQAERDPMVVTANLEALADLIGGPLPAGIDPRHGKPAPEAAGLADAGASTVEAEEPPLVIPEEEDEADAFDVQPFTAEGEAGDMGWMSTVTTDLAASGLADLVAAVPAAATASPSTTDSTGLSGVLGVAPFDINELEMEEESSTSVLERTAMVGPNTDRLEPGQVASGPATSPHLDEEYQGDDAETATSIFAQPMSELDAEQVEVESPTEAEPASPAPEQPEGGYFRARVAPGRWASAMPQPAPQAASVGEPEGDALHSPWDGGQSGMSAGAPVQAEAQAPAQVPIQEHAQEQEAQPAFEMPKPGDPTISGPLPVLTGYEDLVELMEKNPQDTGSYMAMATAYADAGEMENALRVYRRLIKRPGVSATLLNMVDEELEELRATAGTLPRYHQVRGDLFLKLGRHREAIDEYNKLV